MGTHLVIFPESLDPFRDFGKNFSYPLPWIFNKCASMIFLVCVNPTFYWIDNVGEGQGNLLVTNSLVGHLP